MGRSQRHKVEEQGFSSRGAFYEQGAINDAICKVIDGDIPGAIPVITSLDPAFVVVGGANVTLRVLGEKFGPNCVIYINGWDEETVYVGPGEVTTGFTTSLFLAPAILPVLVKKANTLDSNVVNFEVRAVVGELAGRQGEERVYPMGPFALLRIEPSEDPLGVWFILDADDGENLREGDAVLIEATGSSSTNGNYTVTQLTNNGDTRFFVPDLQIAAPVDGKGRVTVNAGA